MCQSNDRLMLQYKLGSNPWADAQYDEKQQLWSIVARAEHLRWLCSVHWRQERGVKIFDYEYPKYRSQRRMPKRK